MYAFVKHPAHVFLTMLALSCLVSPTAARSTSAQLVASDVSRSSSQTVIEPGEFETFVDGFMKDAMAEYHIPGVTFAAVKDGEIYLLKGYGFADLEGQIPVDPQRHVFRVASISKLFVATAIMQLYERGISCARTAFHGPRWMSAQAGSQAPISSIVTSKGPNRRPISVKAS